MAERTRKAVVDMGFKHGLRDPRPFARAHRARRALGIVADNVIGRPSGRWWRLEAASIVPALDLPIDVCIVKVDGQCRGRGKDRPFDSGSGRLFRPL
jgi:hypothetical protein